MTCRRHSRCATCRPASRAPTRIAAAARLAARAALAFGGLAAGGAAAQQEVWRIDDPIHQESFGAGLTTTPDVDGDGIDELVVGAPSYTLGAARVRLLSGATFDALAEWWLPDDFQPFGLAIAAAGDQDSDGRHDFLIGGSGDAVLLSGATGRTLRRFVRRISSSFGSMVMASDDVDGDGRDELLVGAPFEFTPGQGTGALYLYSSATGRLLWRRDGSAPNSLCGGEGRVARIDDLDGDSVCDLALLDRVDRGGQIFDVVKLLSPKDGSELHEIVIGGSSDRGPLVSALATIDDLDRDGRSEVVITSHSWPTYGRAHAFALSLATGRELWRTTLGPTPSFFVTLATGAGDLDGDGLEEFAIGRFEALAGNDDDPPRRISEVGGSGPSFPSDRLRLVVTLHRSIDGQPIRSFVRGGGTLLLDLPRLRAEFDADGDGVRELLIADPNWRTGLIQRGSVAAIRWSDGATIVSALGDGDGFRLAGPIATVGDLGGDGRRDLVVSYASGGLLGDGTGRQLRIVAGKDGTTVRRFGVGPVAIDAMVAVPDQDGDGKDDLALQLHDSAPRVEIRSTEDGALLAAYALGTSAASSGTVLAAATQPKSGAAELAVAEWDDDDVASNAGKVTVVDLALGTVLFEKKGNSKGEQLGRSVAWLGDVDKGGVGDWAMGAPFNDSVDTDAGRVAIVSGIAGGQLKALFGTAAREEFGSAVAGLGDVDSDGVPDLAVSAPGVRIDEGEVRVYSGADWSQLSAVEGLSQSDRFGERLMALGDVDGDGRGDWAATGAKPARIEVRSGFDGALLARTEFPSMLLPDHFSTTADWQPGSPNRDAIRDLFIVDRNAGSGGGNAWLVVLDDLLLQIEPPRAWPNDTVFATLRGAPSGNAALLELVAIDGLPVSVTLDAGVFDAEREWFTCGVVPPGLSGTTWTLRGHATGWSGGLVQSLDQELTFE